MEKIFAKYICEKDFYTRYPKNPQKSTVRKQATSLRNKPKILTDTSPKRIFRWQINIKKCSTLYVIKEMQIKMRYHYTLIRMVKIQTTDTTK